MSDRKIIKQAVDQVGQEIGKLQGRLFVVESEAAAIRSQIQRLDPVLRNLQEQLHGKPSAAAPVATTITPEEAVEILRDRLPVVDPASQPTCLEVLRILLEDRSFPSVEERNKAATVRLEKHPWKQGEAIALAQQVARCLRSV